MREAAEGITIRQEQGADSRRPAILVGTIGRDSFRDAALSGVHGDMLVAFLRRDVDFLRHFAGLEALAGEIGPELSIRIVEEDFVDELMRICGVGGTPAFVLFRDGREVGRILGEADLRTLLF